MRLENKNYLFGGEEEFGSQMFTEEDFLFNEFFEDYMRLNLHEVFKGNK
jgi:hypothetical protein